jgi:ankyrin repeat protein
VAAANTNEKVPQLLIAAGADVNKTNAEGETPFHTLYLRRGFDMPALDRSHPSFMSLLQLNFTLSAIEELEYKEPKVTVF